MEYIDELIKKYDELFVGQISNGIQQSKDEIKQVAEYIGDRKFNNMAEGGVDDAGSFWLYANLFLNKDGGKFTAIDPRIKPIVNSVAKYLEENYDVKTEVIRSKSINTNLHDLDFVHIDGWHAYESVKEDFYHFYPRVVAGGIIIMHDTVCMEGVKKFKDELEAEGKYRMVSFKGEGIITRNRRIQRKAFPGYLTGITIIHKE